MYARVLHIPDQPRLESFLAKHADRAMVLRSNLRLDGIEDNGGRFAGVYAGAFDEQGALRAVVAHYRISGNLFPLAESEAALDAAVACAVEASAMAVRGVIGPRTEVRRALARLGLAQAPCNYDEDEGLYALELNELRPPALLSDPDIALRPLTPADAALHLEWWLDYEVNGLGAPDTPEQRVRCQEAFERKLQSGEPCLLTRAGIPCATSGFNARLPDRVQVGGVYTPPALRSRGYARAAVALSLLHARSRGVTRAVLFTGDENLPAITAYRALGFARVGAWAIVLLS